MSFWSRLSKLFTGGGAGSGNRMLDIYVLSRRCDEPIAGQVDLLNELSRTEDTDGAEFYTRKVLHTSGDNRCFDQVEVNLWFDRNKRVVNQEVTGGRWLEGEEYETELARFNARMAETPPAEEEPPPVE
jgi:hypothetical protein